MAIVSMLIFGLFIGGFFWSMYALLCNWLFRLMLGSISLPIANRREYKRERFMTFIVFLSLPMSWPFGVAGILILLVTYIAGIYYHFRQRKEVDMGVVSAAAIPIVPRMALNELMVMTFSLAFFPVLIGAITDAFTSGSIRDDPNMASIRTAVTVSAFVIGILIFPLCFASAYHRLEANKVKSNRSRMLFLFIYPYMTFAMHILMFGALFLSIALAAIDTSNAKDSQGLIILAMFILGALVVMLTGIFIGRGAAKEAAAASESVAEAPHDEPSVS